MDRASLASWPRLRDLGARLLPAAGELVARAWPRFEIYHEPARALAGLRRCGSGGREGPLDRGAERIGDAAVLAFGCPVG